MYDELVRCLRRCVDDPEDRGCAECKYGKEHPLNYMCISAMIKEAADAIEELQKAVNFYKFNSEFWEDKYNSLADEKWIPVTERLPEEYTRVIGFMAWKAMTAIEYQNGKWYSIDHLEPLPDEAITHWMPLPEPPKEE